MSYIVLCLMYSVFVVTGEELYDYLGGFAEIGQLPYVVHVYFGSGYCTGAIIHEEWVLTAAHCFHDPSGKEISSHNVKILAGIVDYKDADKPSKQESRAESLIIHPSYQHLTLSKHDLALVKLEKPFKFDENVNKTHISGDEWAGDDPVKCTAAGFGNFDLRDQKNSKLKMFDVLAVHGDKSCPCLRRFHKRRLVCLKPERDSGICTGDSGGALVCGNKTVGVAHMIMDKNSCSFKRTPKLDCGKIETIGIYMFVCPYLDWLRLSVPNVPPTPASCNAPPLRESYAVSLVMLFFTFSLLKYL